MSEKTAVATKTPPAIPPERLAKIEEARARAAVAKAVRASVWGKDLHPTVFEAVIAYCRQNQLDAVRHVEVLGGRIYLTSEFYDERGAALLHSGEVMFDEPDYINADVRLDDLAKAGDAWAADEALRRKRERIRWNVPETVRAAVVQRAKLRSGMVAVGVNWCGNVPGGKKDPVGDAEPTKTAQTRARRRAWRQIADFVPSYAAAVRPIEDGAKTALPVTVVEASVVQTRTASPADPYQLSAGDPPARAVETDEDLLAADREVVESEKGRTREPGEE